MRHTGEYRYNASKRASEPNLKLIVDLKYEMFNKKLPHRHFHQTAQRKQNGCNSY